MTPEDFPVVFAEGWALDKPEPFLDYFRPLIHDNATFVQPMFPDAHGPAEVERMFRKLFSLFPDLRAETQRFAINGDTVFIESECTNNVRGRIIRFPVCDRFAIRDGKLLERQSYSDPLPVVVSVFRHPTMWRGALRSRTL
jgi:limonene-1,2-epoxide hydrolase